MDSEPAAEDGASALPDWLRSEENYAPCRDSDGFIAKCMLTLASVLSAFRLDDGRPSPFSPPAPLKMLIALASILMISLSRNFLFTLTMLAAVLVRSCLLPRQALVRTVRVAFVASAVSFLIMLPGILLGQAKSPLLVSTKIYTSVSIALIVATTTPFYELTGALSSFGLPDLVVMCCDLALRNIVRLGEIALEMLCALRLRSVGKMDDKGSALGGIGGTLLLKSQKAVNDTGEAMACRGFDGTYHLPRRSPHTVASLLWACVLLALIAFFVYTQGLV